MRVDHIMIPTLQMTVLNQRDKVICSMTHSQEVAKLDSKLRRWVSKLSAFVLLHGVVLYLYQNTRAPQNHAFLYLCFDTEPPLTLRIILRGSLIKLTIALTEK